MAMGDIAFLLLIFFVILARVRDDSHIQWKPADGTELVKPETMRVSVAIDRDNSPDGTVGVHLQKPDELKAALAEAGLLDPDIERGINIISAMSRDDSFATVKVKDREISLLGQRLTTY